MDFELSYFEFSVSSIQTVCHVLRMDAAIYHMSLVKGLFHFSAQKKTGLQTLSKTVLAKLASKGWA